MTDGPLVPSTDNQTFREPVRLPGGLVAPSHVLFQPTYRLSEANFLRLKSKSQWLIAAGSAVLTFGLNDLLPLISRSLTTATATAMPIPALSWWIAGVASLVGASLIGAGFVYSGEQRAVLRSIAEHFKDNPGEYGPSEGENG